MTGTSYVTILKWLLHLTSIALGVGLFAPCMTIHPGFGEYTWLVDMLRPYLTKPTQYSIIGGIEKLFIGGHIGVGIIVFLFSVAFPITKLSMFYIYIYALPGGTASSYLLKLAQNTSKFGMLDVFVVALYIVTVVTLPGGTWVKIHWWGFGAFVLSVTLSIVVSIWIKRIENKRSLCNFGR